MRRRWGGAALCAFIVFGPAALWIAHAQDANPGEWTSYNVNWSEQRFSPLDQIDAGNVERLGLAWQYDIPAARGGPQTRQEATPVVHNGVLYSIAP